MKRAVLWLVPLLAAPLPYSSYAEYQSAKRKFAQIESERLRPGSRVSLTAAELESYAMEEMKRAGFQGLRQPRVELGWDTASGSALIDFNKIRRAQGKEPNWLMAKLFSGERPVKVTARVQSAHYKATIKVQRVEVSGMAVEGRLLDFLIDHYLRPNYPEAKVGEAFELGHRIERLEVQPGAVSLVIGR